MKNRIKALRKALNLSQRALAQKVGISQQHVQRIESSEQMQVGFALAVRLAKALGQPLEAVFPQAKRTLRKASKRNPEDPAHSLFHDDNLQKEIEAGGIHMDVRNWLIRMKLRGHKEEIDVWLADGEYGRLWDILQTNDVSTMPFVVFEGTDGYRYAVHQKHLLAWHFIFEVFGAPSRAMPDDERVRLWFADGTPVIEIEGEPDEPSDFHETGPLDYIFSMLELLNDGERNSFSITDSAGEVFWFCADEVTLFAAPDALIALDGGEDDRRDEDEDARKGPATVSATTTRRVVRTPPASP